MSTFLLSTQQASLAMGITRQGVIARIHRGKLPAVKIGRDWLIESDDILEAVLNERDRRERKARTKARGTTVREEVDLSA